MHVLPAPVPVVVEVVAEPPAPKPARLRKVDGVPLFEEPDF
jgi:hypothetical protein